MAARSGSSTGPRSAPAAGGREVVNHVGSVYFSLEMDDTEMTRAPRRCRFYGQSGVAWRGHAGGRVSVCMGGRCDEEERESMRERFGSPGLKTYATLQL